MQEQPSYRILVVDDNPSIREILKATLAAPGREILTCTSGASGLKLIEEHGISLVLLDLLLPDMDGRRFLETLRGRPETAGILVIVLSALDDAASKIQCFALGIETFFVKPFDPKIIEAAVTGKLMQLSRSSSEALHDPLTGLWNRAAFKDAFNRTKATLSRADKPLSVAILDFDRFKSVNDSFGHAAGDEVLRRGAAVIEGALRTDDVLARWGGEEFVVLLPNSNVKSGVIAIRKALDAVRAEKISLNSLNKGQTYQVTFSAGVALVTPDADVEQAVCEADRYLYKAKAAGRNRVVSEEDAHDVAAVKMRILLADDDKLITIFMQHKLEKEGFDVVVFHDGADVLTAASTADVSARVYSLCILDVHMPGMNGFDLLANLRNIPAYADVPIMLLTALGGDKAVVRGMELGADDYIVKPFSSVELLARVRRLLKKRH